MTTHKITAAAAAVVDAKNVIPVIADVVSSAVGMHTCTQ